MTSHYRTAFVSRLSCGLVFVIFAILSLCSAQAQIDLFLKFTPTNNAPVIEGDSDAEDYPGSAGWFVIKDFSIGATNGTVSGSSGGSGAGRLGFLDFELNKNINAASPTIFQALAAGHHYGLAELVVRKQTAGKSKAFLTYEFRTVFFTAQSWVGADGGDVPLENLRMAYGSFRITYRPENPNGSLGNPIIGAWNQISNNSTF